MQVGPPPRCRADRVTARLIPARLWERQLPPYFSKSKTVVDLRANRRTRHARMKAAHSPSLPTSIKRALGAVAIPDFCSAAFPRRPPADSPSPPALTDEIGSFWAPSKLQDSGRKRAYVWQEKPLAILTVRLQERQTLPRCSCLMHATFEPCCCKRCVMRRSATFNPGF